MSNYHIAHVFSIKILVQCIAQFLQDEEFHVLYLSSNNIKNFLTKMKACPIKLWETSRFEKWLEDVHWRILPLILRKSESYSIEEKLRAIGDGLDYDIAMAWRYRYKTKSTKCKVVHLAKICKVYKDLRRIGHLNTLKRRLQHMVDEHFDKFFLPSLYPRIYYPDDSYILFYD